MNKQLMKAVVDAVIFVGMSGDDVVDPDAAVAQLEALGSDLKGLPDSDRKAFIAFVNEYAADAASRGEPQEVVEFIRGIPDNLGL